MNYIKALEAERDEQRLILDRVHEELTDLVAYLNSPKFNCGHDLDKYVNTQDVINRLQNPRFLLIRGL